MPVEKNNTQANTGGTAAGMQISGEQIFNQEDNDINKESISAQDVQEAFGTTDTATAPTAGATTGNVTAKVGDALNQAKETTTKVASQAFEQVQEKAGSTITEGKQTLAQGLSTFADGIRQLGDNLRNQPQQSQMVTTAANYVDPLAQQLESVAHYLERQDLVGLSRDLKGFARRNPTLFVGGAFALGLIAARFLKSRPQQALALRNSDIEAANRRSRNTVQTSTANINTPGTGIGDAAGIVPDAAI